MLTKEFWDKYFKVYDVLNLSIPYQELLNDVVKSAKIKRGDLILEAGVGSGNLAVLLEKEGGTIVGLDFCQSALDIYKKKNPKAQTVLADLTEKLPFPNEKFDIIVSNNALYNLPREKRADIILELARILKPDGKIVLSNLNKNFNPFKILLATIKKSTQQSGVIKTIYLLKKLLVSTIKIMYYNIIIQRQYAFSKKNLFDFEEQKELLEQSGFKNISQTKFVYANQGILNSAVKI